jgi:hypothetical protein
MPFPAFYAQVRKIVVHDPLAEFLGAVDDGVLEYSYYDAVKLAGHSCPTVAGAYLMTLRALTCLYPDGLPERGGLDVEFRDDLAAGVTGVIANVTSLVTGAAQAGGFKGIGGRFDRRDLLRFGVAIGAQVRFRRRDTNNAVSVRYRPERVPPDPALAPLLAAVQAGRASPAEQAQFRDLWQARVQRLLIDHADDPELVVVSMVHT